MGFLNSLLPIASAAGDALQGYAQDKQRQLNEAVTAIQLARQADNDRIANALKTAQAGEATARAQALTAPPPKPKRSLATFSVNGTPTLGSMDEAGNFFDASGNPVTNAQPYNKPPDVTKSPAEIPGTPEWKAAKIAEAQIAAKYGYHPPPEPAIVTGTNPDGTPSVFRVPKQGGAAQPVEGITPKATGGAGGALGTTSGNTLLAQGRIGMSYNDLVQAVKQMDDYENQVSNLQNFTAAKRAMGAVAQSQPNSEAHGLSGLMGNALTAFASGEAQQHLAQNDQAYQNYIYNAQRVAAALTELLPRPNQQLLGIEKGLSAIDVGGNAGQIQNVQARRHGALQMIEGIMQHGGVPGAGSAAGSASPRASGGSGDAEFDALMASLKHPRGAP